MPSYSDPTLLTVVKKESIHPGAWFALIGAAICLVFAGYFLWQWQVLTSQITTSETNIARDKQTITSLQSVSDELTYYNKLAIQYHSLFDNQKRWDAVLTGLEGRLYKTMTVTAVQLADQGTFTLAGVVPNFTDYAKFYASLIDLPSQAYFNKVRPVSISKKQTGAPAAAIPGKPAAAPTDPSVPDGVLFSFNLSLTPTLLTTPEKLQSPSPQK